MDFYQKSFASERRKMQNVTHRFFQEDTKNSCDEEDDYDSSTEEIYSITIPGKSIFEN